MADERIQIARGSLELGVLSRAEAGELLGAGFLQPTDTFRADESQQWQPLGQLVNMAPPATGAFARVKGAAANVGASATRVAARLIAVTSRGGAVVGEVASRLLEDYLPRIRESVAEARAKSADAIDSKLQDESFLRKVFGAAYDTLPKPVRRFVGEEAFVEFCFKHRTRLLGKRD